LRDKISDFYDQLENRTLHIKELITLFTFVVE
jgi:hypothetical protein